jgi:uncharacterized protein (DUF4213/DUF364 family)
MRLPSVDSTVVRTLRVATYNALGIILIFLSDRQALDLVGKYYPHLLIVLVGIAPTLTAVINALRPSVKNW